MQEKTEVDSGPARAPPPSCLHPKVFAVLDTLCSKQLMERAVVEMKYDIKKAPLGIFISLFVPLSMECCGY